MPTTNRTFAPFFQILSKLRTQDIKIPLKKPQFALVESFWHIGRLIVENEQAGDVKAIYGDNLIDTLAGELSITFGKGYTPTNLRWARQLYLNYPIHHTLCDEFKIPKEINENINWSHYRTLLKIENISERNFYIEKCENENWSVRFLKKMLNADFYHHRNYDYTLPRNKENFTSSWRQQKLKIRNNGITISGWAFIHPKSIKIQQDEVLFYQLIDRCFMLFSEKETTETRLSALKQNLADSFGYQEMMLLFYLNPKNEIIIDNKSGNIELAIKMLKQFQSS